MCLLDNTVELTKKSRRGVETHLDGGYSFKHNKHNKREIGLR